MNWRWRRAWGAARLLTVAAAWSIDYWTGAMREHDAGKIDVTLKPKQ
jgi:hypothetical protein